MKTPPKRNHKETVEKALNIQRNIHLASSNILNELILEVDFLNGLLNNTGALCLAIVHRGAIKKRVIILQDVIKKATE